MFIGFIETWLGWKKNHNGTELLKYLQGRNLSLHIQCISPRWYINQFYGVSIGPFFLYQFTNFFNSWAFMNPLSSVLQSLLFVPSFTASVAGTLENCHSGTCNIQALATSPMSSPVLSTISTPNATLVINHLSITRFTVLDKASFLFWKEPAGSWNQFPLDQLQIHWTSLFWLHTPRVATSIRFCKTNQLSITPSPWEHLVYSINRVDSLAIGSLGLADIELEHECRTAICSQARCWALLQHTVPVLLLMLSKRFFLWTIRRPGTIFVARVHARIYG